MRSLLERWVHAVWYNGAVSGYLLIPFTWLYGAIIKVRSFLYAKNWRTSFRANVPVVVVGNVTAGGVGKTPLVIWLVERLQQEGYKPGVITRGYGGEVSQATRITPQHTAAEVGDEALMMSRRVAVPVVVGRSRARSAKLIQTLGVNVVIADDGLQHYALQRDLEICVVDGQRMYGNRRLLPSGPLREPLNRLDTVDVVVKHLAKAGEEPGMTLGNPSVWQLTTGDTVALTSFAGQRVHAVAGLGNPQRFFSSLEREGLDIVKHTFPDHHAFTLDDLTFNDNRAVLMTDKDAVKCADFALEHFYSVRVDARLSKDVEASILDKINALDAHRTTQGETHGPRAS